MSDINTSAPADLSISKYNPRGLLWDALKGLLGLILVGLPLIFGDPVTWLTWFLYGLVAIFLVFLGRLSIRFLTEISCDENGLYQVKPSTKAIMWDNLSLLKLRYYSTKKSGEDGWMHLQLKAGHIRINLDSQLDRFDEILHLATKAAMKKNLSMDAVTLDNLNASGINISKDLTD